jgi:hypothetical protein
VTSHWDPLPVASEAGPGAIRQRPAPHFPSVTSLSDADSLCSWDGPGVTDGIGPEGGIEAFLFPWRPALSHPFGSRWPFGRH